MLFQLALLRPNLAPPRGAVVLEELPFDAVAAAKINFSGMWTRVHSDGLVESLVARGRKQDEAEQIASAPYIMKWERAAKPLVWKVTTMQEDMKTPIRSLEYPLGEWKETIANFDVSAPFDEAGVVARTPRTRPLKVIGGWVFYALSFAKRVRGDGLEVPRRGRNGVHTVLGTDEWRQILREPRAVCAA